MQGILLISHGPLAEGMLKTAEIFFGENIPQMKALVLNTQDDPEDFRGRLQEATAEVDTGEGVLVFADLLGGTPCNQALTLVNEKVHQSAFVLNEKVTVLTGMNLPMVMECLGLRMGGEVSVDQLEETAKTGIVNFNKMLEEKKKAGRSRRRGKEEAE